MDSQKLRKASKEFNRYRAPECRVKTIKNTKDRLVVKFEGTGANFYCCYDENFIDYLYYLKDHTGESMKIKDVRQPAPDSFIVIYEKD